MQSLVPFTAKRLHSSFDLIDKLVMEKELIMTNLQDTLLFQVFYVMLQFYSPQPKRVTIERQVSEGSGWERWQLFADDCQTAFGLQNNGPLPTPTSVNCLQFGTYVYILKLNCATRVSEDIIALELGKGMSEFMIKFFKISNSVRSNRSDRI